MIANPTDGGEMARRTAHLSGIRIGAGVKVSALIRGLKRSIVTRFRASLGPLAEGLSRRFSLIQRLKNPARGPASESINQ